MSVVEKLRSVSVDDYLRGEERSEVRHELVRGAVYAMVGSSNAHNLVAGAIYAQLRNHLRESPCSVFMSDMKVRVDDNFYYPDLVVTCQSRQPLFYFVTEPTLIVEVLSPSTETRDRLDKRGAFQSLATLQEYVLVAQDKVSIEIIRRIADGWEIERCSHGDTVQFRSVNFACAAESFYEGVITP
jgi:Uma2 family endonuclease